MVAIHESFLCEIWGYGVLWWHQQGIRESFLIRNLILDHFKKVFSHESFPLYGIIFTELSNTGQQPGFFEGSYLHV